MISTSVLPTTYQLTIPTSLADDLLAAVKRLPTYANTVCWHHYTIEQSVTAAGVQLSDELLAVLDDFEALLANTSRTVEFAMDAEDILFLDN